MEGLKIFEIMLGSTFIFGIFRSTHVTRKQAVLLRERLVGNPKVRLALISVNIYESEKASLTGGLFICVRSGPGLDGESFDSIPRIPPESN